MHFICDWLNKIHPSLPKHDNLLPKVVPSEGILLASKEVKELLEKHGLVSPTGNMSRNRK